MSTELPDLTRKYETNIRARQFVSLVKDMISGSGRNSVIGANHPTLAKTAVAAINDPDLATNQTSTAFLEMQQRKRLLTQMAVLPAPMAERVPIVLTDPVGGWSRPIPVSAVAVDDATMEPTTLGCILGFSREFARSTNPAAISLLERHLGHAIVNLENTTLLDATAASTGVRPQGLLYGLSAVGTASPSVMADDLELLWTTVRDGDPQSPYFICSPRGAVYLAALADDGVPRFPNVSPLGGSIFGVPQLVSKAAANHLILVDANSIAVADAGLAIDVADAASVEMSDSPSAGGQARVSAWQTNTRFIRIQRYFNWALGHDDGVGFLDLPINGSPA